MEEVYLGIDMGGTRIKLGLITPQDKLIKTTSVAAQSGLSLSDRLEVLEIEINQFLGNQFQLLGIGLVFPGVVNNFSGKILSRYVKYRDAYKVDLKMWGSKIWQVPLHVENDARAALIGEWQFGSGRGFQNIVMLTLGTGVGSAVLLEGKILRGQNFIAGNLGGHMSIEFEGESCNCGNLGCVETVGSTWALKNLLSKMDVDLNSSLQPVDELGYQSIFEHAMKGDIIAKKIKKKSLEAWSAGTINLLHAYDPELLILGGGVLKSKHEIIPFIRKRIDQRSWLSSGSLKIRSASQINYAGILGAYYMCKNL